MRRKTFFLPPPSSPSHSKQKKNPTGSERGEGGFGKWMMTRQPEMRKNPVLLNNTRTKLRTGDEGQEMSDADLGCWIHPSKKKKRKKKRQTPQITTTLNSTLNFPLNYMYFYFMFYKKSNFLLPVFSRRVLSQPGSEKKNWGVLYDSTKLRTDQ